MGAVQGSREGERRWRNVIIGPLGRRGEKERHSIFFHNRSSSFFLSSFLVLYLCIDGKKKRVQTIQNPTKENIVSASRWWQMTSSHSFFFSIFSSHFELSCEKKESRTNSSYIFFLPYLQRTKKQRLWILCVVLYDTHKKLFWWALATAGAVDHIISKTPIGVRF